MAAVVRFTAIGIHQGDRGGGLQLAAGAHLHQLEGENSFRSSGPVRLTIASESLGRLMSRFAHRQFLEGGQKARRDRGRRGVASSSAGARKALRPLSFAPGRAGCRSGRSCRLDDLVGEAVLEHGRLVDARFMREGIAPTIALLAENLHPVRFGDQPRGLCRSPRCGSGVSGAMPGLAACQKGVENICAAHAGPSTSSSKRGVCRARSADLPFDGALHWRAAVFHRSESGHSQAEVGCGHGRRSPPGLMLGTLAIDAAIQGAEFTGVSYPIGVGDVDRVAPAADGRFDHFVEVFGSLRPHLRQRELHILNKRAAVATISAAIARPRLCSRSLCFQVGCRGGDEGVDAPPGGPGPPPRRRP